MALEEEAIKEVSVYLISETYPFLFKESGPTVSGWFRTNGRINIIDWQELVAEPLSILESSDLSTITLILLLYHQFILLLIKWHNQPYKERNSLYLRPDTNTGVE